MGLESYFIHLLPKGVIPIRVDIGDGFTATDFRGKSAVKASSIVEAIQMALPCRFNQDKLVVDESIEVWISGEKDLFQKATLVGCLAWYDEGLKLCYQISCVINQCVQVQAYQQVMGFVSLDSEEIFYQSIRDTYQKQYQAFIGTFGDIKAQVLPGRDFHDFYRGIRKPGRKA